MTSSRHALATGSIVLATLALGATMVVAQRGGGAGGGGGAKPLVPLTAATILRDPATHTGENASLMAAVEAVLSKTAFTVDQDRTKSTGQDLLVIAPTLTDAPVLNAYVTVQGEIIKFDPEEVARKVRNYTLDMPADAIEKFRGKPAVIATAVITQGLTDLAKKPIPPMTPDDVVLSGYMKTMNPVVLALRGGLDKPDPAVIKEQAATIKKGFTDIDAFFKTKGMADALKIAGDALQAATSIEQSANAGKFDDVRTSVATLQQTCTACHTARRDRMDDGTYRLRIGG